MESCLIYGGTKGVGLLIAERLVEKGLKSVVIGRTVPTAQKAKVETYQIDFTNLDGFEKNRRFLKEHPEIRRFIFNIGGSFGVYDTSPDIKSLHTLVNLNIGYVIDTINYLERLDRLIGSVLVFIISDSVRTRTGSLQYRMLKTALDEYSRSIEENFSGRGVEVIRVYPPLILYPNRYLANKYMNMNEGSERSRFVANELGGSAPVTPEHLADSIVSSILRNL